MPRKQLEKEEKKIILTIMFFSLKNTLKKFWCKKFLEKKFLHTCT